MTYITQNAFSLFLYLVGTLQILQSLQVSKIHFLVNDTWGWTQGIRAITWRCWVLLL